MSSEAAKDISAELASLQSVQTALTQASEAAKQAPQPSFASLPWTPDLVRFLALSVLVFTFAALLLASLLLLKSQARSTHILRVFGVIIIIGMSALLLVVGYSNEQLTPIVGLFGAIAGYLLGKDSQPALVRAPDEAGITTTTSKAMPIRHGDA
jgi:hypothetical protein